MPGHVALTVQAAARVVAALRDLAANDRVAGGTTVAAVAVARLAVQVVLRCPASGLSQRVGRLKSRSATLLSFEPEWGVGGANTWGRGFWRAGLLDDVAFGMVSAIIESGGPAGCPE